MTIHDKTLLITGANRGIGRALVDEALRRGVARVYAGVRGELASTDDRVTPLLLDVTDPAQIQRAADTVETLDILINNAGVALYDDLADVAVIERHLAVNTLGPLRMTRAFLPQLSRSRGAVVNNLSLVGLAPFPLIPAYSMSKAAAFSISQSLRTLLAPQGVSIHAVMLGPVDTDMNRGLDIPKASPGRVAQRIFDGLEQGLEEIFPDSASEAASAGWTGSAAKLLERQFAALTTGRAVDAA
jgi:NAD(P)-dependent dehydrogenase (short-subunit alcohol dehydrogenase family)